MTPSQVVVSDEAERKSFTRMRRLSRALGDGGEQPSRDLRGSMPGGGNSSGKCSEESVLGVAEKPGVGGLAQ